MWIILLFVCISVILPNNAQELTSFETESTTETPYPNSGVSWDSARPPVTLTIRNGRTDNVDQSIAKNSDIPLFYSNQWHPMLMPVGLHGSSDSNGYEKELEDSVHHQLVPTFLRRPDIEANNTVPYYYTQLQERNEFTGVPLPYAPIFYFPRADNLTSEQLISYTDQTYAETLPSESLSTDNLETVDVYKNTQTFIPPVASLRSNAQSNINTNGRNFEMNTEPRQTFSSSVPKSTTSDPISSRIIEESNKNFPIENHHAKKELPKPSNFYRESQRFFPPMVHPYFAPYSLIPFQRDGRFQPMIPYPPNDPNFDRESGPAIDERIPEILEKPLLSDGVSDRLEESVPSETSTDVVPPSSLPLPVPAYPFGLYPPPFAPPLIQNIPDPGFGLNLPLPQPTHMPRENIIADASRPSLPITPPVLPISPFPEVFPDVLPQTGNIATEEEARVQPDLEENPEETIPDEKPNLIKIPYEFGFDMNDGKGNDQHRKEVSDISGVVTGSYGFRDAFGIYRLVTYIADKAGFRAHVQSNEPGISSSSSADVVMMAERPPPGAVIEGKNQIEPKIIGVAPEENTNIVI